MIEPAGFSESSAEAISQPHYNVVYDDLVKDSEDLVGMIAYAYYKRQKREAIQGYRDLHGKPPEDPAMRNIHLTLSTPSSLEAYRDRAGAVVEGYSAELSKTIQDKLSEQLYEDLDEKIKLAVMKAQPNFLSTVGYGALSSIVVSIGVLIFAFLAAGSVMRFLTAITVKAQEFQVQQAKAGTLSVSKPKEPTPLLSMKPVPPAKGEAKLRPKNREAHQLVESPVSQENP
jgi:hypothetical protein